MADGPGYRLDIDAVVKAAPRFDPCKGCGGLGYETVSELECCQIDTADGCCGHPVPVPAVRPCPAGCDRGWVEAKSE